MIDDLLSTPDIGAMLAHRSELDAEHGGPPLYA